MEPKYLLIVKPAAGLNIWDTPRPQGQGAIKRRSVAKGTQLYAYDIFNFQGVPYAWLVPQDPTKPEWVRVSEAGSLVPEYCEYTKLSSTESNGDIVAQLTRIANALEQMAGK